MYTEPTLTAKNSKLLTLNIAYMKNSKGFNKY